MNLLRFLIELNIHICKKSCLSEAIPLHTTSYIYYISVSYCNSYLLTLRWGNRDTQFSKKFHVRKHIHNFLVFFSNLNQRSTYRNCLELNIANWKPKAAYLNHLGNLLRNIYPPHCQRVQSLWQSVWILWKLTLHLPYDPVIPFLGIRPQISASHSRHLLSHAHCCSIHNSWKLKQPNVLQLTNGWWKCGTHTLWNIIRL